MRLMIIRKFTLKYLTIVSIIILITGIFPLTYVRSDNPKATQNERVFFYGKIKSLYIDEDSVQFDCVSLWEFENEKSEKFHAISLGHYGQPWIKMLPSIDQFKGILNEHFICGFFSLNDSILEHASLKDSNFFRIRIVGKISNLTSDGYSYHFTNVNTIYSQYLSLNCSLLLLCHDWRSLELEINQSMFKGWISKDFIIGTCKVPLWIN
jgi:hypothetical protein